MNVWSTVRCLLGCNGAKHEFTHGAGTAAEVVIREIVGSLPEDAVVVIGERSGVDRMLFDAAVLARRTGRMFGRNGRVSTWTSDGTVHLGEAWSLEPPPSRDASARGGWMQARTTAMVRWARESNPQVRGLVVLRRGRKIVAPCLRECLAIEQGIPLEIIEVAP